MASELEYDLDTLDWDRDWLFYFSAPKALLVSFDWSKNSGTIDVKITWVVLEEKSSLKMLGLSFSSEFDWGSKIVYIAKTGFKKIGALIRSVKLFFPPEVAPYLYKSTILPYREYCCHVLAGVPSCDLDFLDKLQKHDLHDPLLDATF